MPRAVAQAVIAAPPAPVLASDPAPVADLAPTVPTAELAAAAAQPSTQTIAMRGPMPTPRPTPEAAETAPRLQAVRPWIVVHHGPAIPAEDIDRIATVLIEQGFHHLSFRPVAQAPDVAQARFFHPQDRDAAEAVGRALGDIAGVATADFTHFAPAPDAGLVELWVAGRS